MYKFDKSCKASILLEKFALVVATKEIEDMLSDNNQLLVKANE